MNRQQIMLSLINQVKHPLGKTALVKLLYLVQEVCGLKVGYDFSFYTHGPFTNAIIEDLEKLEEAKSVEVKYNKKAYEGYGGFEIKPKTDSSHLKEEVDANTLAKIRKIVDDFGNMTARDLELRTTLHYIRHKGGLKGKALYEAVHAVKPKYSLEEIRKAAKEIENLLN